MELLLNVKKEILFMIIILNYIKDLKINDLKKLYK